MGHPGSGSPGLSLDDEDSITEVVYALRYLEDALLRAGGRGEQFQPYQRFIATALFTLARRAGVTPRTLLNQLFKTMPSDEEWRSEVLPLLERQAAQVAENDAINDEAIARVFGREDDES